MVQSENRKLYIDFKDTYLFDELFRQYSKPLFYFAAKFVEDEVAKDIVQDVFVKLWSGHEIIISKSLNALLFTMVKNSCLQHLEKEKVRSKYIESPNEGVHLTDLGFQRISKSMYPIIRKLIK